MRALRSLLIIFAAVVTMSIGVCFFISLNLLSRSNAISLKQTRFGRPGSSVKKCDLRNIPLIFVSNSSKNNKVYFHLIPPFSNAVL